MLMVATTLIIFLPVFVFFWGKASKKSVAIGAAVLAAYSFWIYKEKWLTESPDVVFGLTVLWAAYLYLTWLYRRTILREI